MKLNIAGEEKTFEDGLTVDKLIDVEQVENPEYVTVSVNDEFVRTPLYGETVLHDGDRVEFLYFMGGGAR
jgi:sulfur carrier protein